MSIPTSPSTTREQAIPSRDTSSSSSAQSPPSQVTSSNKNNNNHPMMVTTTNSSALQKRRFLLFIKILFKSLEQASEFETRDRAREIVSDCTRRNRLGDPAFTPLIDVVDQRLRRHVGEFHWRRAHVYMQHYIITRGGAGDPRMSSFSSSSHQTTRRGPQQAHHQQQQLVSLSFIPSQQTEL